MKLSRIIFPSSGYQSALLSYWTVVVIIFLLLIFTALRIGFPILGGDTSSYYAAGDLLFNGTVSDIRTPIYPIILRSLQVVFGFEGSMIAVAIIQILLFALSVVYVNKSIRLITPKHPRLCFWVTVLFVLLQVERWHGLYWVVMIMSDAFAVDFAAFLTYCIIRAAQSEETGRYTVWTTVWLLLLVFLRPVMVCYIPVVLFFWGVLYLKCRREALKKCLIGIGGIAVIVSLIGCYYYEVNKKYHIHSISFVSSINNYAMLRYGGIITPDDTDDSTFKNFLEKQIAIKDDSLTYQEQWEEIGRLLFDSIPQSHVVVEQAVNHAIKSNPKAVVRTIINRYKEVNDLFVSFVNLLIIVVGVVIVAFFSKYRQISPIPWTLFLFVLSLRMSLFVGAMDDWQRLSVPMTPMLSIVVGWAFSKLRLAPPNAN